LASCPAGRLIDWLTGCGWLTGWVSVWLAVLLLACCWQAGWLRLVTLAGFLASWLSGFLHSCILGFLSSRIPDFSVFSHFSILLQADIYNETK
jgi:hypothetical protein